jgi:hypothetical protein
MVRAPIMASLPAKPMRLEVARTRGGPAAHYSKTTKFRRSYYVRRPHRQPSDIRGSTTFSTRRVQPEEVATRTIQTMDMIDVS